jgi:hypothetical protein
MNAIRKLPLPGRGPIAGGAIFIWVAVSPGCGDSQALTPPSPTTWPSSSGSHPWRC